MLIKDIQFFKYVIPRHYTIFLPDIWEGTSNRISDTTIFFDFKMKKIECCLHRFHVIKKTPKIIYLLFGYDFDFAEFAFFSGQNTIPTRPVKF